MVSFESTEIAFRIKSDRDLDKAYWLFRAISNKKLVRLGGLLSRLAINIHFPIKWIVKPTIYRHFCGGETIEDCLPAVARLSQYNVKSILDYSVEGKEDPAEIQVALDETLRTIDNAAKNEFIPFTVFKPTAFAISEILEKKSAGESLTTEQEKEADNFRNRIDALCKKAYDLNVPIMVDAEDYCYQKFIDEVVMEMMEEYNREKAIVYNTYQMYRCDRMDIFRRDLELARSRKFFLGIKFVRGAYMEKERERAEQLGYPSPIHPDKESTDRDFDHALTFAVENIDRVSIFNGTHNEKSSLHLVQLMEKHGLAKNDPRCYFSQLYGMSDHITFNLAHQGYNAAKYLPYGPVKSVLPYLIRRTEENTSIAGQTGREMNMIIQERKRRKSIK
ncbi:MAG: proline dehydrogenase [Bacteroides sp. SM23_62_1]|nr:MAG: proline dehydrogenase [Bacteroides sp. SM23_62_1]